MVFKKKYGIFDFEVNEYLIKYSINKNTQYSFLKRKYNDIGILILEIKDWSETLKIIRNLFQLSLFDSFSIQIEINRNYVKGFLIINIFGVDPYEIDFRYKNLISKLNEIVDNKLNFFKGKQLERAFLSILSINRNPLKSSLSNLQIIKEKEGFHYLDSGNSSQYPYFYLIEMEADNLFQNSNNFSNLIETLYSMNIKGNLISYSLNSMDFILNSCYLFGNTNSIYMLENELQQNLKYYNIKPLNSFHPLYLGKILLRNSINHKNLKRFRSPPIFNSNISFKDLLDSKLKNYQEEKLMNSVNQGKLRNYPSSSLSISDSHSNSKPDIKLNDNKDNAKNFRSYNENNKIKNSDNKKDLFLQVNYILRKIDKTIVKKSNKKYYLFGSTCCFIIIDMIHYENLNSLIDDLSKEFSYFIIYFNNSSDFNLFKLKLNLPNYINQNFLISFEIDDLVQKLMKIKMIKKTKKKIMINNIKA